MLNSLKVGSRSSPLAIKQVQEVRRLFPFVKFRLKKIMTSGDEDKTTPLSEIEGSDFFTKEIDRALLKGAIDLAIHSSKDLPDILPRGLAVALETISISPYDALVSRKNLKFSELAVGSSIGVSSKRRKEQIIALRKDLEIVDIRGNIEERLSFIDNKKIDALIIAHAALIRLGLEEKIAEIFSLDIFKAHLKQGSLSLVVREKEWQKVRSILSVQGQAIGN